MSVEDIASNYASLQDHEERIKELERKLRELTEKVYHLRNILKVY